MFSGEHLRCVKNEFPHPAAEAKDITVANDNAMPSYKEQGEQEIAYLHKAEMEHVIRSFHDLDTGRNHVEEMGMAPWEYTSQSGGDSSLIYSTQGDLMEDVMETINYNYALNEEPPAIDSCNSVDTLKTSYDTRTGEFLVHIGKLSYPVDLVEFTNDNEVKSSVTYSEQWSPEASPNQSFDNSYERQIPSDTTDVEDVIDTSPESSPTPSDCVLYPSHHDAEYSFCQMRPAMVSGWLPTLSEESTFWSQEKPTTHFPRLSTNLAYPQELLNISGIDRSNYMLQEDPLVDSLIGNYRNKFNSVNSPNQFRHYVSSSASMVASKAYIHVERYDNFNCHCYTNRHEGEKDVRSCPYEQEQLVESTDESACCYADFALTGDISNMRRECRAKPKAKGKPHPRAVTGIHAIKKRRENFVSDAFEYSKNTNKQCSSTTVNTRKRTATQPQCNRKFCQFDKDQYCKTRCRGKSVRALIKSTYCCHGHPHQWFCHLKRGCRLWEFIRNLLLDPSTNPAMIRWEDREAGTFRLVQSKAIAAIWGSKKGNDAMNYEKLSRAMRYYYKRQIFAPVLGKRLVYSFGPRATGWRADDK